MRGTLFQNSTILPIELGPDAYRDIQTLFIVDGDATDRMSKCATFMPFSMKRTSKGEFRSSQGNYFLHSKEICIVAEPEYGLRTHVWKNMDKDLILEDRDQLQSKKPTILYQMIERLLPSGKYGELFGRVHNLRNHWTTFGNEFTFHDSDLTESLPGECYLSKRSSIDRKEKGDQSNADAILRSLQQRVLDTAVNVRKNTASTVSLQQPVCNTAATAKDNVSLQFHSMDTVGNVKEKTT